MEYRIHRMAAKTDPAAAALQSAKLIVDLTRQLGALVLRVEAIEKRLGAPARPKSQRLNPEEWLARKRAAMEKAAEHRWPKKQRREPPAARRAPKGSKTGHRRGKGRSK